MIWKKLIKDLTELDFKDVVERVDEYEIYPRSLTEKDGTYLFMTKISGEKKLVIMGEDKTTEAFKGELTSQAGKKVKIAPLNHENAEVLRKFFDFTNPIPFGKEGSSLGLGDRLGLATPGHIAAVRNTDIKPVFAQQSFRELNLTNRTYEDVLDAVSWAVFQEGYREGFGADGDHLKSKEEIEMALELGFSMLTLDCSDHIDNTVNELNESEVDKKYSSLPHDTIKKLEELYLRKTFNVSSTTEFTFNEEEFKKIVLTYIRMIEFTKNIYTNLIKPLEREIDFEVSIDETATPTTPQAHYFVASELERAGIKVNSLAPRFCGEFQKGIDYIGDLKQFEREFKVHAEIADSFGYKLSIHSGSDKFSIFPIIGKYTRGRVHVKTAGTNWLEAIRIIAEYNPDLYREIHQFALEHFEEATKYYHVTTNINNVPALTNLADDELVQVLENNDGRQLLHITYGLILQAKKEGEYLFKDKMYKVWNEHEADYSKALQKHIGKHIRELGMISLS